MSIIGTLPKEKIAALVCSALLVAPCTHAATLQLLTPVKPNVDTPVVLEWQSDPAGIYTVEYSVGLANDWKVVEEGFPSQGTTTRWTDRGTPAPDRLRFSSADASATHRFYRIKQERLMDTSLPITVTITSPNGGATLANQTEILGTVSAAQGIASVKLYVDGYLVSRVRGPSFSLPVETRLFPNGIHRISVVAEDIGAVESAEEPNSLSSREASYGVGNINVNFDNSISGVRLRYEHFRPELGQMQQVFALWSSPRNWRVDVATQDGTTVFRSFTGSGNRVAIGWNGRDTGGQLLNPQLIGYFFNDLGPGSESLIGGGIEGGAPLSPAMAAVAAGQTSYFIQPPPLPPALEKLLGPLPPKEVKISKAQEEKILAKLAAPTLVQTEGNETGGGIAAAEAGQGFGIFQPYSVLGTFAVAGQGHHPLVGVYPPPPRTFGGSVRMSSQSPLGPWGRLKRVRGIVNESADEFTRLGYSVLYKKLDDEVLPEDLAQDLFSPPNIFNRANIGLYVGHSVAAKDIESGFGWLQSYVPIFNGPNNSMAFVGTTSMSFGSEQLKWMAFFSCNLLRDELYRSDGVYDQMKNSFTVPLNGYLHILQAYATEMSVHPEFAFRWTLALRRSSVISPANHSVIGAWNYACRNTQPTVFTTDPINVARSVTWPECQADFIFGYGPQTEPNRDPFDPSEQEALLEIDHAADSPEP